MKEKFASIKLGPATLAIIEMANDVIDEYMAGGFRLTLRQLYYQFISRDLFPESWHNVAENTKNTERNYKRLGSIINDGRMIGMIDWDAIQDRGRGLAINGHWNSIGEMLEVYAVAYRIDLWEDQPCHCEVMVEKQALEGILDPLCRKLDIGFTANKGYSSASAMYEAGKRMASASALGKEVHIFYLGDHDPSGIDMTRDVDDRLNLFSGLGKTKDVDGRYVEVHRVALNMDQVKKLRPPPNPAKMTDSRASGYVEKFGYSSWELDAIEPKALAKVVENAIAPHIDDEKMEVAMARQTAARAEILKIAKKHK